MLRSVARVGGQLRATVLGAAGTVEGFDTFWESAASIVPRLAGPDAYPHHRLGNPARLRSLLEGCRWVVEDIVAVTSVRMCEAEELWRWLWGALPLLREDGTYVHGPERSAAETDIRTAFFDRAERMRSGTTFTIRSLAHMAIAVAGPTAESDPTEPDPTQPDPTQPDPTQPDATQPDPTQPDATQPDAIKVTPPKET